MWFASVSSIEPSRRQTFVAHRPPFCRGAGQVWRLAAVWDNVTDPEQQQAPTPPHLTPPTPTFAPQRVGPTAGFYRKNSGWLVMLQLELTCDYVGVKVNISKYCI